MSESPASPKNALKGEFQRRKRAVSFIFHSKGDEAGNKRRELWYVEMAKTQLTVTLPPEAQVLEKKSVQDIRQELSMADSEEDVASCCLALQVKTRDNAEICHEFLALKMIDLLVEHIENQKWSAKVALPFISTLINVAAQDSDTSLSVGDDGISCLLKILSRHPSEPEIHRLCCRLFYDLSVNDKSFREMVAEEGCIPLLLEFITAAEDVELQVYYLTVLNQVALDDTNVEMLVEEKTHDVVLTCLKDKPDQSDLIQECTALLVRLTTKPKDVRRFVALDGVFTLADLVRNASLLELSKAAVCKVFLQIYMAKKYTDKLLEEDVPLILLEIARDSDSDTAQAAILTIVTMLTGGEEDSAPADDDEVLLSLRHKKEVGLIVECMKKHKDRLNVVTGCASLLENLSFDAAGRKRLHDAEALLAMKDGVVRFGDNAEMCEHFCNTLADCCEDGNIVWMQKKGILSEMLTVMGAHPKSEAVQESCCFAMTRCFEREPTALDVLKCRTHICALLMLVVSPDILVAGLESLSAMAHHSEEGWEKLGTVEIAQAAVRVLSLGKGKLLEDLGTRLLLNMTVGADHLKPEVVGTDLIPIVVSLMPSQITRSRKDGKPSSALYNATKLLSNLVHDHPGVVEACRRIRESLGIPLLLECIDTFNGHLKILTSCSMALGNLAVEEASRQIMVDGDAIPTLLDCFIEVKDPNSTLAQLIGWPLASMAVDNEQVVDHYLQHKEAIKAIEKSVAASSSILDRNQRSVCKKILEKARELEKRKQEPDRVPEKEPPKMNLDTERAILELEAKQAELVKARKEQAEAAALAAAQLEKERAELEKERAHAAAQEEVVQTLRRERATTTRKAEELQVEKDEAISKYQELINERVALSAREEAMAREKDEALRAMEELKNRLHVLEAESETERQVATSQVDTCKETEELRAEHKIMERKLIRLQEEEEGHRNLWVLEKGKLQEHLRRTENNIIQMNAKLKAKKREVKRNKEEAIRSRESQMMAMEELSMQLRHCKDFPEDLEHMSLMKEYDMHQITSGIKEIMKAQKARAQARIQEARRRAEMMASETMEMEIQAKVDRIHKNHQMELQHIINEKDELEAIREQEAQERVKCIEEYVSFLGFAYMAATEKRHDATAKDHRQFLEELIGREQELSVREQDMLNAMALAQKRELELLHKEDALSVKERVLQQQSASLALKRSVMVLPADTEEQREDTTDDFPIINPGMAELMNELSQQEKTLQEAANRLKEEASRIELRSKLVHEEVRAKFTAKGEVGDLERDFMDQLRDMGSAVDIYFPGTKDSTHHHEAHHHEAHHHEAHHHEAHHHDPIPVTSMHRPGRTVSQSTAELDTDMPEKTSSRIAPPSKIPKELRVGHGLYSAYQESPVSAYRALLVKKRNNERRQFQKRAHRQAHAHSSSRGLTASLLPGPSSTCQGSENDETVVVTQSNIFATVASTSRDAKPLRAHLTKDKGHVAPNMAESEKLFQQVPDAFEVLEDRLSMPSQGQSQPPQPTSHPLFADDAFVLPQPTATSLDDAAASQGAGPKPDSPTPTLDPASHVALSRAESTCVPTEPGAMPSRMSAATSQRLERQYSNNPSSMPTSPAIPVTSVTHYLPTDAISAYEHGQSPLPGANLEHTPHQPSQSVQRPKIPQPPSPWTCAAAPMPGTTPPARRHPHPPTHPPIPPMQVSSGPAHRMGTTHSQSPQPPKPSWDAVKPDHGSPLGQVASPPYDHPMQLSQRSEPMSSWTANFDVQLPSSPSLKYEDAVAMAVKQSCQRLVGTCISTYVHPLYQGQEQMMMGCSSQTSGKTGCNMTSEGHSIRQTPPNREVQLKKKKKKKEKKGLSSMAPHGSGMAPHGSSMAPHGSSMAPHDTHVHQRTQRAMPYSHLGPYSWPQDPVVQQMLGWEGAIPTPPNYSNVQPAESMNGRSWYGYYTTGDEVRFKRQLNSHVEMAS